MVRRKRGRSKKSRIYWRGDRAYLDARSYAEVGGGREALIPRGAKTATTDPDVAEALAAERVRELERMRRNKTIIGTTGARLGNYCAHHLELKRKAGRVGEWHLLAVEQTLRLAIDYFGADTPLDVIGVRQVEAFMNTLAERPNGKGGTLSAGTRRHYLNNLSNIYRRAQGEGIVPPGYNPCAAMMEKPQPRRYEARWLEVHEAALLLEAARTYRPKRPDVAAPGIYPILATFLLTGGRKAEVLGLDVEDLSFDRRTVTFRPNRHRRLKTSTSHRVVPLWPQLEAILREWVFDRDEPPGSGVLFPAHRGRFGPNSVVGDLDKQLDVVANRCGWESGSIRSKMFRHTYCAARLQTLDRAAPVSPYTVAKELGHGGLALVSRVYGHLGEVRHRAEVVEYRVDQHTDALGRLQSLRAGA